MMIVEGDAPFTDSQQAAWVDNGDGTESRTLTMLTAKRSNGVAATCTVTVTHTRRQGDRRVIASRNEFVEAHDDATHVMTSEEVTDETGARFTRFESVVIQPDGTRKTSTWHTPDIRP